MMHCREIGDKRIRGKEEEGGGGERDKLEMIRSPEHILLLLCLVCN